MLYFNNVTKLYPEDFLALNNVNLRINEGEFVSIVGRSGAGKSTLLKLLYAEEKPTEGGIYFGEQFVNELKKGELPHYRRKIGTIFQDFKLLPQKTVFENVAFALEVLGETDEEIDDKVPQILDLVGLANKMEKFPSQLSGGEQQKTSIARALIHAPKVIIADEPTGNLDPANTWEIINLLLKINEFGTTVLLASHDKDVIDKIKRRVITMEDGRIARDIQTGGYNM